MTTDPVPYGDEPTVEEGPRSLVDAFCREHRRRLPGLLSAVILTGSATLDDWQPGISDVDLVLITARPVASADWAAIADIHAATKKGTVIDGVYLTESRRSVQERTKRIRISMQNLT